MRGSLVTLLIVVAAFPLSAQEVKQQGTTLMLPSYTDQQRWTRMTFHSTSATVTAIAYAKARGQSVEDLARFLGEQYSAGWGAANTGVPVRTARAVVLNYAAFPNSEAQLVSATDTSATVRFRRSYRSMFDSNGMWMGVSVAEFERLFDMTHERIMTHLGLRYASQIDGDWMSMSVSGKGANALTAVPRGAFTQTLTAEQAGSAANAGTFSLSFLPDGKYELSAADGEVKMRGRYSLWLDQLTASDETGPWACTGAAGTYRFTPQTNGDVVLGRLSDNCDARARFFARRWLKK